MSYKAICPPMSQHTAEELGKWLAEYKVDISGLAVHQIDVDGKRHSDNALVKTIKDTVGEAGMAVALTPVAIPLLGMFPPLAAILAAINVVSIPSLLGLKKAEHALNKRIPEAGGKQILHTELTFGLSGVSDKRLKWSEYLLAIYASKHDWQLTGLRHPEQLAAGARAQSYPTPWSQQTRQRPRRDRKPARPARPGRVRDWLEDL